MEKIDIDGLVDEMEKLGEKFEQNFEESGAAERWEITNLEEGWDLEDVKTEFDDFWEKNDPLDFDLSILEEHI